MFLPVFKSERTLIVSGWTGRYFNPGRRGAGRQRSGFARGAPRRWSETPRLKQTEAGRAGKPTWWMIRANEICCVAVGSEWGLRPREAGGEELDP